MNFFEARNAAALETGEQFTVTRRTVMQRPAPEVYRFWRNPQNARGVVPDNVDVFRLSETRSHWTARLPGGRRLQCTVERIADEPGRHLAWRAVADSDVDFEAELWLSRGGSDAETNVKLTVHWTPPSGWAGALLAHAARARAGRVVENLLEHARTVVEAADAGERKP